MCGIAGILSWSSNKVEESQIRSMTDSMRHRGPDGEGIFVSKEGQVGFGHRRLSIIDLSEGGAQPFSLDDRYTITFNGEIYNYIEIRSQLESLGHKFKTESDTEVLLVSYKVHKEKCLDLFDGMFALCIWDDYEKTIFCARDRFGEKPFFYSYHNSQFIFASEIKALFKVGVSQEVNKYRLYDYLAYNSVQNANNQESTFYSKVSELKPGHYLVLNQNGREIENTQYWSLDKIEKINPSVEEASARFFELFQTSIERRLRSDVAVGSSLSGGLDSSAIVAIIDQIKGKDRKQKTFSARFKDFDKDEGYFMNLAIENASNIEPHFSWPASDLIAQKVDEVFHHQEAPFGSSGILVQGEIMKLAKENNVTVLLDGQGADEYLGGYHYFYDIYLKELYRTNKGLFNKEQTAMQEMHAKQFNKSGLSFLMDVYAPNLSQKLKNKFKKDKRKKSIHPDFLNNLDGRTYPFEVRSTLEDGLKSATTKKGLSELLNYADRNSMMHSREVRLPFLFHELVEYTFSLPSDLKIRSGWTKYILRHSMQNHLPKEIVWRKDKIGYMPPKKRWLENSDVVPLIQDSIKILKSENIIQHAIIGQEWQYIMAAKLLKHNF